MNIQDVSVLPAPLDDPLWSTLRVKPYCRSYLRSLEGQKKYESAWQAIRGVFRQMDFKPSSDDAAFLKSERVVHAQWHEPTWDRPRIEQGKETCLVRKDFFSSSNSEAKKGAGRVVRPARTSRRARNMEMKSSVGIGRPPGVETKTEECKEGESEELSSVPGMEKWDSVTLFNIEKALARSDLMGLGRLRCTCSTLRVPRALAPGLVSKGRKGPEYRPLVSVTTAHLAELPISGGQLYLGSFVLPVRAGDFPALQNWFSSALSQGELAGACLLLCRVMPNCFEYVSGCGLPPKAVEGFHAFQEVMLLSKPGGFRGAGPPLPYCCTHTVFSLLTKY